jgi:predicted phosphoribosyltransferase
MLASQLASLYLTNPVVLAIPRGGIETAAPIAERLDAELDVVLSRKLRSPDQPELAIGAVSESGEVHLDPSLVTLTGATKVYVEEERARQEAEIERRRELFRTARPPASLAGRTVILTDDGVATGSTMIAAARTVRAANPLELIIAVPVAAAERLSALRPLCDRLICLNAPTDFTAVGPCYERFEEVTDDRVLEALRMHAARRPVRR